MCYIEIGRKVAVPFWKSVIWRKREKLGTVLGVCYIGRELKAHSILNALTTYVLNIVTI